MKQPSLEIEQCILTVIQVNCVNVGWLVEQVIKGIVACSGDHQYFADVVQLQQLPVNGWIFPAAVVNEEMFVNKGKPEIVEHSRQTIRGNLTA